MRRTILFLLLLVSFSYSQTIREMRFENVKLETVLRALSEVSGMNVILDPAVSQELQRTVSVAIYRPVPVGEAMNIILKEYGLIAVPVDKRVFRITKSAEISVNVAELDDRQISEVINFLKARVSPSAEIVLDKILKTIYVRDEERNIKKIEPFLKDYKKLAGAFVPVEARITRVFYLRGISLDEAERRIKPYTKPDTVITKAYDFSALVISDSPKQMKLYEEALKPFLTTTPSERKPVTKIFYLKYISPDEFIKMIEPLRSEAGLILSGGTVVEREVPQPQQQAQQEQQQAQGQQQQVQRTSTPIIKEFNAVMITDYPDVIEAIKERFRDYISDSPVRVLIEARIVEVSETATRDLGIDWSAFFSQANVPQFWSGATASSIGIANNEGTPTSIKPLLSGVPASSSIMVFTYQKGTLNALNLRISALERINKAKNLAKPTVITINGQKATIKQGIEVPYQSSAPGAGGTAVQTTQFKEVVLQLDVTPVVSPDGRVMMEIELKRDTLAGAGSPPPVNKKEVKTKVIVENGQTAVLGGIIDTQESIGNEGVPGLVRVPILKYLAGKESKMNTNTELLIFITPVVLTQ